MGLEFQFHNSIDNDVPHNSNFQEVWLLSIWIVIENKSRWEYCAVDEEFNYSWLVVGFGHGWLWWRLQKESMLD